MIIAAVLFVSCKKRQHHITSGIYYWKTIYAPGAYELNKLKQLHCQSMYLRLYDVDWDAASHAAIPVAPIRLPQHLDTVFKYIPVVFIKQEVLLHVQDSSIGPFAQHIAAMTRGMCTAAGIVPAEVQIDCDWTGSTRDIYFELLQQLHRQAWFKGKLLSATIRLHQVKYKKSMGIPPVDKGLLMCYNMGDIKNYEAENSIIDPEIAKEYLDYLATYPLRLDVALPLFDWCLLFRDKQLRGILRDIPAAAVKANALVKKEGANKYSCLRDTVWAGYKLKAGDVLRPEDATTGVINEVAAYTAKKIKQDSLNVVFFHCDSLTLSKYSVHELEKVLDNYR